MRNVNILLDILVLCSRNEYEYQEEISGDSSNICVQLYEIIA